MIGINFLKIQKDDINDIISCAAGDKKKNKTGSSDEHAFGITQDTE